MFTDKGATATNWLQWGFIGADMCENIRNETENPTRKHKSNVCDGVSNVCDGVSNLCDARKLVNH